jgi:osmotically inducible protein OsmC
MSIAERTSTAGWEGSLATGHGIVAASSGAFDLPVTWAARTEAPGGKTSPEELAAAAHASCFAMALTLRLGERALPPQRLDVSATVRLEEVDGTPTIVSSALVIRARIEGLDPAGFQSTVDEAAQLCPVSRLFAGAAISVHAELDAS